MSRHDFVKLVAGGSLAVLFTATVFGPMGLGRRYVDELQHRVRTDLDANQLGSVEVTVEHEPTLRRNVILSGEVSPQQRATAMRISRDVAGVANVRWATAEQASGGGQFGQSARF